MERDLSTVAQINDWAYLIALETGLFARGELSGHTLQALNRQARLLSRRYLIHKARLDVRQLSPAQSQILDLLSDVVANLRRRKRLPHNLVRSLRAGGLIATVERSVCASGVLQSAQGFQEEGIKPGAFERIVLEHPAEFGAHARQHAEAYFVRAAVIAPPVRRAPPPVLQASA